MCAPCGGQGGGREPVERSQPLVSQVLPVSPQHAGVSSPTSPQFPHTVCRTHAGGGMRVPRRCFVLPTGVENRWIRSRGQDPVIGVGAAAVGGVRVVNRGISLWRSGQLGRSPAEIRASTKQEQLESQGTKVPIGLVPLSILRWRAPGSFGRRLCTTRVGPPTAVPASRGPALRLETSSAALSAPVTPSFASHLLPCRFEVHNSCHTARAVFRRAIGAGLARTLCRARTAFGEGAPAPRPRTVPSGRSALRAALDGGGVRSAVQSAIKVVTEAMPPVSGSSGGSA